MVAYTGRSSCRVSHGCQLCLTAVLALPCENTSKAMHAGAHVRSAALQRTVSGTKARTYSDFWCMALDYLHGELVSYH